MSTRSSTAAAASGGRHNSKHQQQSPPKATKKTTTTTSPPLFLPLLLSLPLFLLLLLFSFCESAANVAAPSPPSAFDPLATLRSLDLAAPFATAPAGLHPTPIPPPAPSVRAAAGHALERGREESARALAAARDALARLGPSGKHGKHHQHEEASASEALASAAAAFEAAELAVQQWAGNLASALEGGGKAGASSRSPLLLATPSSSLPRPVAQAVERVEALVVGLPAGAAAGAAGDALREQAERLFAAVSALPETWWSLGGALSKGGPLSSSLPPWILSPIGMGRAAPLDKHLLMSVPAPRALGVDSIGSAAARAARSVGRAVVARPAAAAARAGEGVWDAACSAGRWAEESAPAQAIERRLAAARDAAGRLRSGAAHEARHTAEALRQGVDALGEAAARGRRAADRVACRAAAAEAAVGRAAARATLRSAILWAPRVWWRLLRAALTPGLPPPLSWWRASRRAAASTAGQVQGAAQQAAAAAAIKTTTAAAAPKQESQHQSMGAALRSLLFAKPSAAAKRAVAKAEASLPPALGGSDDAAAVASLRQALDALESGERLVARVASSARGSASERLLPLAQQQQQHQHQHQHQQLGEGEHEAGAADHRPHLHLPQFDHRRRRHHEEDLHVAADEELARAAKGLEQAEAAVAALADELARSLGAWPAGPSSAGGHLPHLPRHGAAAEAHDAEAYAALTGDVEARVVAAVEAARETLGRASGGHAGKSGLGRGVAGARAALSSAAHAPQRAAAAVQDAALSAMGRAREGAGAAADAATGAGQAVAGAGLRAAEAASARTEKARATAVDAVAAADHALREAREAAARAGARGAAAAAGAGASVAEAAARQLRSAQADAKAAEEQH